MPPFAEALQKLAARLPVGADLSSSQWADVPVALRERAFFSARVTNAQILQEFKDLADGMLAPRVELRPDRVTPENPEGRVNVGLDLATARAQAKEFLKAISYDPGDKAGTIQDLGNDRRIELILNQNVQSAQGYGNFLQGQGEGALDAFPAQELFRAEDRKEERPWPTRWMQAGGQIFGGRMIALKTSPIWEQISAFGTPWPPFDFNSGMWVRDIPRSEAIDLGLLAPNEVVEPGQIEAFNARLEASVEDLSPDLLTSLQNTFGDRVEIVAGKVRWVE